MYDMQRCSDCGEPTEIFPDGLCSSCSLERTQHLDMYLEEFEPLTEFEADPSLLEDLYLQTISEDEDDLREEDSS